MARGGLIGKRAQFPHASLQRFVLNDANGRFVLALMRSRVREALRLIINLQNYRRSFMHDTGAKQETANLHRRMHFCPSPGTFCWNKQVYNYLHLHSDSFFFVIH